MQEPVSQALQQARALAGSLGRLVLREDVERFLAAHDLNVPAAAQGAARRARDLQALHGLPQQEQRRLREAFPLHARGSDRSGNPLAFCFANALQLE
jgi:hypothetical protein